MCLSACPRKKRSDNRAVIQEDRSVQIQLCHLVAALEGVSLGPLMLQGHPELKDSSSLGSESTNPVGVQCGLKWLELREVPSHSQGS